VGAIFVRILFTVMIAFLMRLPYLNAVGGLILLWITWKLEPAAATRNTRAWARTSGAQCGQLYRLTSQQASTR